MVVPARAGRVVGACVVACLLLVAQGCTSGPPAETAAEILDDFEAEGLADCSERREPVPDLITCEDEENGDLTVMFTDTEEQSVQTSSGQSDGPWIVGSGFIVVSYDDDPFRVGELRDHLGTGELYGVDEDGAPVPLEGEFMEASYRAQLGADQITAEDSKEPLASALSDALVKRTI